MNLEEELAAEQVFHAAAVAFREAFDAYERTFEHGLDPCDQYKITQRELRWTIELSEANVEALKTRVDSERAQERRTRRQQPSQQPARGMEG